MNRPERAELEVFVTLAQELHFGRTADRLRLSQARVSQLVRVLERRVGGRLFERTSRRVGLTPLGERLLAGVGPAVQALDLAVAEARAEARGLAGRLRVGFLGVPDYVLLGTVPRFRDRHPECVVELIEARLSDPFGPLLRGEVDVAFGSLPVREPGLRVGTVLGPVPWLAVVSPSHRFARRDWISAEDLAEQPVVEIAGPAPSYWREMLAPNTTPSGRPIPRGPVVHTQQEAISEAATGRAVTLVCQRFPELQPRNDVRFVPVRGLPDGEYALLWNAERESTRLRAFAALTAEVWAKEREGTTKPKCSMTVDLGGEPMRVTAARLVHRAGDAGVQREITRFEVQDVIGIVDVSQSKHPPRTRTDDVGAQAVLGPDDVAHAHRLSVKSAICRCHAFSSTRPVSSTKHLAPQWFCRIIDSVPPAGGRDGDPVDDHGRNSTGICTRRSPMIPPTVEHWRWAAGTASRARGKSSRSTVSTAVSSSRASCAPMQ
ncbi:DNA-binding transcriptional LysR family regulator [Stackebrandtia endophytica]|uniref:DNA-binding transcriptional LysR family regulator n=1 Tax=Stackebrandtia endophytica TaxID=1496996 RepID=A0A543B2B7_9ACTN|nr:DNA-binding transcriptional LysR family regulator [Stackebrandtia endophytica]